MEDRGVRDMQDAHVVVNLGVNHAEVRRIWSGVAPRCRPSVAGASSIRVPGRCSAASARHPPPPPHPQPAAPLLQAPATGGEGKSTTSRCPLRAARDRTESRVSSSSRKLACESRHASATARAGCAGGGGCTAPRNDSIAPSASGCAAGAAGRCARISAASSAQAAASPASSATACAHLRLARRSAAAPSRRSGGHPALNGED